MKKVIIKNEKTIIPLTKGSEDKMTFSDLASACLNTPPKEGFDVTTMRNRLDVKGVLDKANGSIELTDVQYQTLKTAVASHRFGGMNQSFVDFVDAVNDAKK